LAALFFGTIIIAIVEGLIAGRDEMRLHEGTAILVTLIGAGFCWVWGWAAAGIILGVLLAWTVVGGLLARG